MFSVLSVRLSLCLVVYYFHVYVPMSPAAWLEQLNKSLMKVLVVRTVFVDRVSQTSRASVCSLRRERLCRTLWTWSLQGDSPTPELYLGQAHITMSIRKLYNKWRITCSFCMTSDYSQMQSISLFRKTLCRYAGEILQLWRILYKAYKLPYMSVARTSKGGFHKHRLNDRFTELQLFLTAS